MATSAVPKVPLNQAKQLVKSLYLMDNRQSVLWIGAPGIGKSEAMMQVAQELADELGKTFVHVKFRFRGGQLLDFAAAYEKAVEILSNPEKYFVFMDIRLTEYEPVDLTGIPRSFKLGKAKFFDYQPFTWQQIASACSGILFLDEITSVQRLDMRAAMHKILRDRVAGQIEFHPDLLVTAAGNSPEDTAIASLLDASVINRVRAFRILPPTVDEWAEYMNKYIEDWDTRVYAFLKRFPQFFFQKPPDVETLDPFPTPRQWTELAKVSHQFDDDSLEYIAYSNVGSEASAHFITFIRTHVPEVEDVMKKPDLLLGLEIDEKYLFAAQFASVLTKEFTNNKKPALNKFTKLLTWLHQYDRELLQLVAVMSGGKVMRKLHAMCLTVPVLRPVAQFFADSIKLSWEAGV